MSEETLFFEIFGNGNSIKITLIGSSHPNAELDWDKNWIKGLVEVKAGQFCGQFGSDFITIDFATFKNELSILYDRLNGPAIFTTLENQANIKITGDGTGHLKAECEVMDEPGFGSRLQFEIDFDQTYIPKTLKQLDKITNKFPKIGELN